MNIFTFIDISEKEQCEELQLYLKSLGANIKVGNDSEEDSFLVDLQNIIEVIDVCFKESSESDIESALNSLVSLIIMVPQENSQSLIYSYCEKLLKVQSNKLGLICVRVLNNLFEGLSPTNPCLFDVYYNLVKLAGQTDSISSVFDDLNKLKKWIAEHNFVLEKVQKLLRLLHEVLVQGKQNELASKVMIELLSTYTEDNASQARDDAHRCIVACLADNTGFLMDHLLSLKPVRFLEGEPIHDLLTIFVSEKLSSYMQFYALHKDFIHSLGLSHEQNTHKMRLLTFMQMAEGRKELGFETLQTELLLAPDDVEGFVIDALRTKMVRARIDQVHKKVLISSTMHRTFGKPQWQQLRETLNRWRFNLSLVDHSMAAVLSAQFDQVPVSIQA